MSGRSSWADWAPEPSLTPGPLRELEVAEEERSDAGEELEEPPADVGGPYAIQRAPTPDPECPVESCQIPVDIFVTASDGTRFGSHKATLQICNRQLYQRIVDCEQNGDVMPHDDYILELLLIFAHVDVEQPNLRDDELDFEHFEELAVQVEEYATKYGYTFLSDKAAPFTVNETVPKMYNDLDSVTFARWVMYRDEWARHIRSRIATCPVHLTRTPQGGHNCSNSMLYFHNTTMKPIFQYGDGKASAVPENKASAISSLGNCADCREAALAWEKGILEFKMRLFSNFVIG